MTEIEKLYQRYFKDVYLFAYSLSKDKYIAEDITSETFIKAVQSIHQFKGNSDIRVWLFQIAKFTYFSTLRKDKKIIFVDSMAEEQDGMNLEHTIISTTESQRAEILLEQLKEPYKEVFLLRVYGKLSFKEIAEVFGKTENWAGVTFHRAKKRLKKEMEEER
ncbi:RNA polymerase sigma factor [Jeotgalibaca caeni]|uniref:RNA polymerase sigma factor n=1 Tax=Jeotgalibaca caeni TaxID=3028623 RepID=UPI00237E3552|nr:RNA polymerase sigma factor [Jeotgalibaca caeni]MDE1549944.1 RNA polymerase sigma factor [Jeotgalibaca caeni]